MKVFITSKQCGQALPLTLILLTVTASIVFYVFNTGQLVQEKIGLTNTADAVAYSAGNFEARMLNYDAYTNRAMIANEIAIGQAVGLASWAKYASIAGPNLARFAQFIPYVGAAIASALRTAGNVSNNILTSKILAISVTANDLAIQALKNSQIAVHGSGSSVALANRKRVMDEVAQQNDPDVVVDLLPISDNFSTFTQHYTSRDQRKRMGQLVENERKGDDFFKRRNWQFGIFGCPVGLGFKKRGSTEFIDMVDGWKSMDTLSFHTYRIRRFSCRHRERPIGYGTAFSKNGLNDTGITYARSRRDNRRASAFADSTSGKAAGFAPSSVLKGAIPEFYELSKETLKQDDPRTQLTIRVSKSDEDQRYSGGASIIKPTGKLDLYSGQQFKGLSASIARVEVFFERPDGSNKQYNKVELGSLFNPYWQVHLLPVSSAERARAALLQGIR